MIGMDRGARQIMMAVIIFGAVFGRAEVSRLWENDCGTGSNALDWLWAGGSGQSRRRTRQEVPEPG